MSRDSRVQQVLCFIVQVPIALGKDIVTVNLIAPRTRLRDFTVSRTIIANYEQICG